MSADRSTVTEPLLDLDRYAATEFRAGYDSVVFKAVAGTVIRSLIQLEIQRQSREQGGLASVLNVVAPIASAVVTQADTRIWAGAAPVDRGGQPGTAG